jgi:hypothetical protein
LFSLLLKFIFIGGPIAILVFMLMATEPVGKVGKRSQARDYDEALNRITFSSRNMAVPFVQMLSEEQINAKMFAELSRQPTPTGMAFGIQSLQLDVVENPASPDRGAVTVHMLTTGFKKKLRISYEMTVVPRGGPAGLEFDIVSARIGHLPLFANLKDFLVGRKIAAALSQMKEEKDILGRLRQLQIKGNTVALKIAPTGK